MNEAIRKLQGVLDCVPDRPVIIRAMIEAIHEIETLELRLKESQAQVAMWFKLQERRDSTASKLAAQISTECSKIRETISAMGRRPAGGGPG